MSKSSMRADARRPGFRVACVESAAECIGTLEHGCRVIGITKGQFSMLDLMRAVIAQTGPADVALSTWTFGIRDVENAAWLIERGEIRSLKLLTDRSFVTRKPEYCGRILEVFGPEAIRATNVHAKFALIENESWSIAIRASMNLNRNARWEQFDLDDDAAICAFFRELMDEMECLMPSGLSPPGSVVEDVFSKALESTGRHKAPPVEESELLRLARLGYTRSEIAARVGARLDGDEDDYHRGVYEVADTLREATISAAIGGDKQARERAVAWVDSQMRLL